MGSKNKLKRFRENETFSNVYQTSREEIINNNFTLKGQWNKEVFKNNNPIVLELGCGKGEYSVELARRFPNVNFIGVDIKGSRFWRGAKTAIEENLPNVAFLRTQIELIENCFAAEEVDEIWKWFWELDLISIYYLFYSQINIFIITLKNLLIRSFNVN